MSEWLILSAIVLIALSGAFGQRLATWLAVAGSAVGIAGAVNALIAGGQHGLSWPWAVPGGEFVVAVDGIAAIFLLPVFLIPALGSIYGLSYWKQADHPTTGRKLRLFYGLMTAAMALVVVAANSILFLVAWEIMALAGFFLVMTEDENIATRDAGWVYLVATHTATLCLFAMFALLKNATGSFALAHIAEGVVAPGMLTAVFLLAIVGFGMKAGIMPLHIWLPGAHAMAPSHVSALMSGVLIKIGIYGIVRIVSLLPHPPVWWGGLLLTLGVVSGVFGVVFAIGQHDLKRLLAYHSVENIGIIVMGLGLAMIGRALGRVDWIALGLAGALLHVWNHGLFKSLLFLSAGSVVHATGTREIDRLGGLSKTMPRTALCFAIGAVAICGLPPLNGFVSELFIYIGLFRALGIGDGPSFAGAAFAAPALALIGALAVACFVKAYGAVFLGSARSKHAEHTREAGRSMIAPMAALVACCFFIGLAPQLIAPALEQGIAAWAPEVSRDALRLSTFVPLNWISIMAVGLVALLAAVGWLLRARIRRAPVGSAGTWDCGYAAPSPTMQYTASSFAQMLVDLFAWVLRPKRHAPREQALFFRETKFHSHVDDTVLDGAILPSFRRVASFLGRFRFLQQGSIHAYLLYIVVILIVLLLWQ